MFVYLSVDTHMWGSEDNVSGVSSLLLTCFEFLMIFYFSSFYLNFIINVSVWVPEHNAIEYVWASKDSLVELVLYFDMESRVQTQVVILAWQALLPTQPSPWPLKLIHKHLHAYCMFTRIYIER